MSMPGGISRPDSGRFHRCIPSMINNNNNNVALEALRVKDGTPQVLRHLVTRGAQNGSSPLELGHTGNLARVTLGIRPALHPVNDTSHCSIAAGGKRLCERNMGGNTVVIGPDRAPEPERGPKPGDAIARHQVWVLEEDVFVTIPDLRKGTVVVVPAHLQSPSALITLVEHARIIRKIRIAVVRLWVRLSGIAEAACLVARLAKEGRPFEKRVCMKRDGEVEINTSGKVNEQHLNYRCILLCIFFTATTYQRRGRWGKGTSGTR